MLEQLPATARPETVILDYRDAEAVERAARGCRAAVHLVGIIKEAPGTSYSEAHEDTCRALASAGAAAGLERVVYLSILGSRPDSPNACLSSKGRAEEILQQGPVPATVLRVPMVLGPGDVASRALLGQARAGLLPLVGGGRTLQQPIDADDVIAAILACLAKPDLADQALDLGGPECLSHRALVERAAALLDRRPRVLPIPLIAMRTAAAIMERASASPPITRAMLEVLQHDDRVDARLACEKLGIQLRPLDQTLMRCVGERERVS
jgi:NADH dehydrogenase